MRRVYCSRWVRGSGIVVKGIVVKRLDRFAALVRDYYVNCGTLQQVHEIKSFPDRIFIPQKMIDADPDNVAYIKERLRHAALQAVDELRLRDSR
jgi:hypothetical protein